MKCRLNIDLVIKGWIRVNTKDKLISILNLSKPMFVNSVFGMSLT